MNKEIYEIEIDESDSSIISEIAPVNTPVFHVKEPISPCMFIKISDQFHVAGEKVSADILLHIPQSLGKASLYISSQGIEEVRVFSNLKLHACNTNIIYNISTLAQSWDDLAAGHYIIPIAFRLPQCVPPTFVYAGEDSLNNFIKAEISYTISAKVTYDEVQLTHSRVITVRSAECRSSPHSTHLRTEIVGDGCCMKGGVSQYVIETLMQEHINVKEAISYKIAPDNSRCKVGINQITGMIIRIMTFRDKGKAYHIEQVVSEVSKTVDIPAGRPQIPENVFIFTNELNAGNEESNPGSVKTNLIKCSYYIDLRVKYDERVSKSAIGFEIPFYANSCNVIDKDAPMLPPDWVGEPQPAINLLIESN